MDKNAIKKFATWARRELIERIRQQAYRYGVEDAKADLYATSAHGVVLTPVQRSQRQALIERMQAKGYEATIEEVAYTWFDRFCALRFMEVNGYLPGRMRMFSDENGAFRPQILTNALNVELEGLDIDTVIQLKEENKTEELFKYLLLSMCNALKPILTLFQPDDRGCQLADQDYTWLLLPDNLLREGSVPEQMVLTIPEDDWKDAVQIVGWLYQYYNAEPKDQVFANLKKNIKISKKDIPAATQLFTPDWIVRYMVENSLGRLWVEGHPDDSLKANWKYYLEEAEQEPEVQAQLEKIREGYTAIKPEEILCIDPCMGSGHILVYIFDVLVQIYEAYGYPTRDAVASIVQNNLWGLDIDDRAAQLANFAVMMVARRYDKGWFRRGIQPHVMAIQESNGIDRNHLRFMGNMMSDIERNNATTQIEALLDEFIDAKEYGSILQPQEYDWEALRRFVRMTAPEQQITLDEVGIDATQERLMQLIEQAQALAQKYHVTITNPPYLGIKSIKESLSDFLSVHYADTKFDVACSFVERMRNMTHNNYFFSAIVPQAMSFAPTFSALRDRMIMSTSIVSFNQLGLGVFGSDRGTVSFVNRVSNITNYISKGVSLESAKESEEKAILLTSICNGNNESFVFLHKQSVFSQIPNSPIAFTCSNTLLGMYSKLKKVADYGVTRQGLATSDNDRFARLWHEVPIDNICFNAANAKEAIESEKRWFPFNKGGGTRRWYGNLDYVVDWSNDGKEMKDLATSLYKSYSRTIKNEGFYFIKSITWSDIGTVFSGREYPQGGIFSTVGLCMFTDDTLFYQMLGYLNSIVTIKLLTSLNPTIHFNVGDIALLPFLPTNKKEIESLTKSCIKYAKNDWDSFEISWDFQQHPFLRIDDSYVFDNGAFGVAHAAYNYGEGPAVSSEIEACFLLWDQECRERFYRLKSNEEELNRIFIDIYGLQDELTPEVAEKDVTVRKADIGREVRSLVSYAVGCMLGRYSLDKPGLQFAGGDWQQWLAQQEKMKYAPDQDGILPITDDEYFGDDIVTMFVEWVGKAFNEALLEENLKFIAYALQGGKYEEKLPDPKYDTEEYRKGAENFPWPTINARAVIRQYFLNDFYKDHLKIYQKRPIYWMFDSGKKNGFKCLVYMHRWQKDTVARVRTDYVHEMQSRYRTAIEELSRRVNTAAGSERVRLQKQLTKVQDQDAELLKYEEKVHHLADQMIAIDLDDGVKHNYAIFEDVLAPIK